MFKERETKITRPKHSNKIIDNNCDEYYELNLTEKDSLFTLLIVLINPTLVLIDHGHFQYNCIGLGLAAGGAAAAAAGRDVLGALLFSLSLNHKQMGLYYAPAFFAYLLGKCLQRRTAAGKVRASRQRPALQFFSFCGGYIAFKLD